MKILNKKTFNMSRNMYHDFNEKGYVYGRIYTYVRRADGLVERYMTYYRNANGDKRLETREHAERTGRIEKGMVHVV